LAFFVCLDERTGVASRFMLISQLVIRKRKICRMCVYFHRVELSKMVTTTLCAAGSFSSCRERATGRDG
jgi:hypothetical protein